MDCAQVGVFEEADQVALASFLQSHDRSALEPQVSLEVLRNLSDQSLEGKLSDQELSRLLVSSDLSQGNSSRSISMRLLHTSSGGCALSSCLCCQLFSGCFSSSALSGSLLCAGHLVAVVAVVVV